jgi:hypothetical protein
MRLISIARSGEPREPQDWAVAKRFDPWGAATAGGSQKLN